MIMKQLRLDVLALAGLYLIPPVPKKKAAPGDQEEVEEGEQDQWPIFPGEVGPMEPLIPEGVMLRGLKELYRCMPDEPWTRPGVLHRLQDSHPQAPAAVPGALWGPPVSCVSPWTRQWQGRSSIPICNCHGVRFQGYSASGIQSCRPPWPQYFRIPGLKGF